MDKTVCEEIVRFIWQVRGYGAFFAPYPLSTVFYNLVYISLTFPDNPVLF